MFFWRSEVVGKQKYKSNITCQMFFVSVCVCLEFWGHFRGIYINARVLIGGLLFFGLLVGY